MKQKNWSSYAVERLCSLRRNVILLGCGEVIFYTTKVYRWKGFDDWQRMSSLYILSLHCLRCLLAGELGKNSLIESNAHEKLKALSVGNDMSYTLSTQGLRNRVDEEAIGKEWGRQKLKWEITRKGDWLWKNLEFIHRFWVLLGAYL